MTTNPNQFGRYALVDPIHVGDHHQIVLAVLPSSAPQVVAVKRLLPSAASDQRFVDRLAEAASIGSRLDHSNICRVTDAGIEEGISFLAREYVSGMALRDLVRRHVLHRRFLPQAMVLHITLKLCDALQYAHTLEVDGGVLHTDVGPPNILVGFDGGVKLINFRVDHEGVEPTSPSRCQSLEQQAGNPLGRHTDVLGVGMTAYELLTGRGAFPEGIKGPSPSADEIQPRVSRALSALVDRAMAPSSRERFPDVASLQLELEQIASSAEMGPGSPDELSALMKQTFPQAVRLDKERLDRAVSVEHAEPAPAPAGSTGPAAGRRVVGLGIGVLLGLVLLTPLMLLTGGSRRGDTKKEGVIRIVSDVPGLTVSIDGENPRALPVEQRLSPGGHRLTVHSAPTGKSLERDIDIEPGKQLTMRLADRSSRAAAASGRVPKPPKR